jgi:carboxymethylenebutenolidase
MCDEITERENSDWRRRKGLSRREFTAGLSLSAIAAMLPPVADAAEIEAEEVNIETPDGIADCYLVHPVEGRHPAVLLWPDIKGIRPAFRAMGRRLAESGYTVLVINPYYRTAKGEVIEPGESFSDPATREKLMPHARSLSPQTCVTDGGAFLDYLYGHDAVDAASEAGVMGYCMTGSYALRLAAAYPERIGAGASFHGGGLATDDADSPHRLAPQMDAGFLIAIAANDDERDPDAKLLLREAFDEAGLDAEIEVYEDTLHGWCPPDSDVYDEEQAERAWSRMLALFESRLG